MTVTISAKGQLVIPAKIRKKYNLTSNMKLEILDTGHSIVLRPTPQKDAFLSSAGLLKEKLTTSEFLKIRHTEKSHENKKCN